MNLLMVGYICWDGKTDFCIVGIRVSVGVYIVFVGFDVVFEYVNVFVVGNIGMVGSKILNSQIVIGISVKGIGV